MKYFSSFVSVSTHSLLVIPRLWMTFLSLANDAIIFKLANRIFNDINLAHTAAILFASSYTSWVYCTRVFSNCIETILFGLLLCLVTSNCDKAASAESEKMPNRNLIVKSNSSPVAKKESFFISAVIVAGVFTRVSFIAFMAIPLMYWLCKDLTREKWSRACSIVLTRIFALIPGAFFTTIFFVLCDSYYFDHDSFLDHLHMFQEKNFTGLYNWISNLQLTPLNCLLYNANASNLAKHGLHPWYLHATINMPLMFTPLVYILIPALSQVNVYLESSQNNLRNNFVYLLIGATMCGLGGLSSVRHQEPRYILPLIIPLTVLLSRCFYPLTSRKLLLTLWVSFNFVYFVFFALLHQGGVVPSMEFVNSLSKAHSRQNLTVEVIYYKTYLPPVHLAALPRHSSSKPNNIKVRDLAGSPHDVLEATLEWAFYEGNSAVYLAFPASVPCSQITKLRQNYFLEEQYSVFPHLSMEDPPWSKEVCRFGDDKNHIITRAINKMTLSFYKVNPVKKITSETLTYTINPPNVFSSAS